MIVARDTPMSFATVVTVSAAPSRLPMRSRCSDVVLGGRPMWEWAGQLNPYDGKWNFRFQDDVTAEAAFGMIESRLRGILPGAR